MVTDAATGQVIWAHTPAEAQIPASNAKILTAVNALEAFGPTHTFTTSVMTGSTARRIVLVGGGDPSLSARQLGAMARTTAAAWLAKGVTRVRVEVDDSLFPAPTSARRLEVGPTRSEDVSPVRALVVDQHRRWDTSLDAGAVFARKLEKWGLDVRGVARAVRPATSTVVDRVARPRPGHPGGGDAAGPATTTSPRACTGWSPCRPASRPPGPAPRPRRRPRWPGSGSRWPPACTTAAGCPARDRLSPVDPGRRARQGVRPGAPRPRSGCSSGSFAVAGVSGTLAPNYLRYVTNPTRCAAGLIQAKTGSLSGVISLSGFARGADGQVKLFSFLLNQVPSTLTTRRAVDRLAATVTGCW